MSDRIFVATRKGLFTIDRSGSGEWGVRRTAFLGDQVTMVLPDPRDGWVYAGLNLGHFGIKLHRSSNGGETWEECAPPAFPVASEPQEKKETNPSRQQHEAPIDEHEQEKKEERARGPDSLTVQLIWSLEPGGRDEPSALWAGTIPGGLFRSVDRGSSWHLNRPLWERPERKEWFGGGYDRPGIHSIWVDPRDSRRVTVGVSCGGVWVSRDRGETWTCQSRGMWAAYMPPERREDPNIQDPHRVVQCPEAPDALWVQHHNGVFRSTDGAASWREVPDVKPSVFGFAVAVHPRNADTAWFVPAIKDECRIPVGGQVVVSRTRDGGRSFEVLREGLPQKDAYDLVYRHGLDVDSEGRHLVMGSTTGSVWISENEGDSWRSLSSHLPPVYCVRFAP